MIDDLRSYFRERVGRLGSMWLEECLLFGMKQAWACIFGASLLFAIIATKYWYPDTGLARYDFLFLYAVCIQLLLIVLRLESYREVGVIVLFHLMACAMELFKTHEAIGSWSYPGEAVIRIGNVPLFAGFMYSAVGSYMARIWRGFEFKFTDFPPLWIALSLALLAYFNFFTHHYIFDIRWILIVVIVWFYRKTRVYFRPDKIYRSMPLLLGFVLVSLFIWFAENISTYCKAWIYPNQGAGWQLVGFEKWTAWFLLMQLSFVLVYTLRHVEPSINAHKKGPLK